MSTRSRKEDNLSTAKRLHAYSKSAASLRARTHDSRLKRTLRRGSLASIVPLTATAAAANAQCVTSAPFGVYALTAGVNSTIQVPVGPGTSDVLTIQWLLATLGTTYYRSFGIGGLTVRPLGSNPIGVKKLASLVSISNGGSLYPNAGFLCRGTVVAPNGGSFNPLGGEFCSAGAGFVGLRHTDGRHGWLELNVLAIATSGNSVIIDIGRRRLNTPPGGTVVTGDCSIALPVELTTFNAIHSDDGVSLRWETASELDNAGFEVQRADQLGDFVKIGFVGGRGTTHQPQSYALLDRSAVPNVRYRYRLKQVDFDGTTSFSEVVEVFTEDPSQIALSQFYPSPAAKGAVRLDVDVANAGAAAIEVFDVRGALVSSQNYTLNSGRNRVGVETDGLAAGPHFAKVQFGGQVLYRPFVVAR